MRPQPHDLAIDIDLANAQAGAEQTRNRLLRLRKQFDLSSLEYTRRVRIAPTEIPHSHPILTLNTFEHNDEALLCTYVHEQMHWYLWRLGSPDFDPVSPIYDALKSSYPDAPTSPPDGANDEYSTYLHLVVNWLEIEAVSTYIGRERAAAVALRRHYYRWIYRTVLADWDKLGALYHQAALVPIRPASQFVDPISSESEIDSQGRGERN